MTRHRRAEFALVNWSTVRAWRPAQHEDMAGTPKGRRRGWVPACLGGDCRAHRHQGLHPAAAIRNPGRPSRVADEWSALHEAFHEALVSACDSSWLLRIRRTLFSHSERYRRLSLPLGKKPRRVDQEHPALMDAAFSRKTGQAEELMRRHLTKTTEALLRLSIAGDPKREVDRGERAVASKAVNSPNISPRPKQRRTTSRSSR